MKNKNIYIWLLAGILLVVAAYTVYAKLKPLADMPQNNAQQQNTGNKIFAPDFTLKDMDGNEVSLSDYKGKIVILNFWEVSCKYCKLEMPEFNELNKQLKEEKDAVILAVDSQESHETVNDYITSEGIGLKVLLDEDGSITNKYVPYGIEGFPTTFIINSDGSFYTYILGATDKKTLTEILKKIRNGEPAN